MLRLLHRVNVDHVWSSCPWKSQSQLACSRTLRSPVYSSVFNPFSYQLGHFLHVRLDFQWNHPKVSANCLDQSNSWKSQITTTTCPSTTVPVPVARLGRTPQIPHRYIMARNCERVIVPQSVLSVRDYSFKNIRVKRVFPKIGGKTPKMDGEKNGKPLSKWMIEGVKTPFLGNTLRGFILPFPRQSSSRFQQATVDTKSLVVSRWYSLTRTTRVTEIYPTCFHVIYWSLRLAGLVLSVCSFAFLGQTPYLLRPFERMAHKLGPLAQKRTESNQN